MSTRDDEITLLRADGQVGAYSDMMHSSLKGTTSAIGSTNDLWLTLFDSGAISAGGFNDRLLGHLQAIGATATNVSEAYTEVVGSGTLPSNPTDSILDTDHPNLVAMYTMDNISGSTLVDESPNGNDGTIVNGTPVAGHIDNALSFAGSLGTSGIDLPVIIGGANPCSIAGWLNMDASGVGRIIEARSTTGSAHILFMCDIPSSGAAPRVAILGTGGFINKVHSTVPTVGVYAFIYASWNGIDTLEVGVNNAVESLSSISPGTFSEETVGAGLAQGSTALDNLEADVDHWRLFDRVLTVDEQTTLYNGGVGA